MGKGSQGDGVRITKTPEAESDFQYTDDEEKHGHGGFNFNKIQRQRAETKNYKPKVVLKDDFVKTFSPGTPKSTTAERAREDLSGEREKMNEPSGDGFLQPCTSICRHSEMDGHNIFGDQEPLQRSCKQALAFDGNTDNDDPIVRDVNRPVYEIQTVNNLPCSQTFSEDPSSSKKLNSSSVPSKTLQVYHRRYEKNQRHNKCRKFQPFFEGHNKHVQVYHRRYKKNLRHNKCVPVQPFFQERKNKMRKGSIFSAEGLKDSPTVSIHKKPRLQVPSSGNGPIVKHSKNSQIHHKKEDALVPVNVTPSATDRKILRTKVILDEETIREWKFLMEKLEQESCKSGECDERWKIERELFRGRVISFVSRMHLIQGNRQFSQWKGSIVDSMAGVFLTQNVADNLSSSAFMSLAAQYPCNQVKFKSTFQNIVEYSDIETRDGVGFCYHSASAETVTRKVEKALMSEKTTESLLSCQSHNGNEKTKLEKSSKGSANTKNHGINRRTINRGRKKKEETRNQQAEPVLRRKNKNAYMKSEAIKWENLRKSFAFVNPKERSDNTLDAIDWHAVHAAAEVEISKAIMQRGMDKKLALRIKNFINRLILEQGNVDLEWLREVQLEKAKEYLLTIYGLGMKSVECIRLLSLQHQAFPVDTNVGRVLVRLGWVPIQPLPRGQEMHLLKMYPNVEDVHKYLWPRLCTLDYLTLYEFHHQMITFGKVFCTKSSPNCNACPMKAECRHFASAFTSARVPLTGPREKSSANIDIALAPVDSAFYADSSLTRANLFSSFWEASNSHHLTGDNQNELITYPALECIGEIDLEDYCVSDIPTITFDCEAFMENLLSYIDESDLSIKGTDLCNSLVISTQEAASIPLPKWKNIGWLRTEHQVYELPDSHPLLEGLENREPEDPCPYLLAIRTPGNVASEEPTKEKCQSCNSDEIPNKVEKCECCNCDETQNKVAALNMSGDNIQTVYMTLLVFADEDCTKEPIEVPRAWIWHLPRKTLYCGSSIRAIFRGMSTKEVQNCFWRGYVCLRGFNRKTRKPGPLPFDLHRPTTSPIRIIMINKRNEGS